MVNAIGIRYFIRADLTSAKMYSLSKASKDTVSNVDDTILVKAYFSPNLPGQYAVLERYLRDMISQHPIKNLKLHKLGGGSSQDITKLAGQSMANLHLNILPYVSEIPPQFQYKK